MSEHARDNGRDNGRDKSPGLVEKKYLTLGGIDPEQPGGAMTLQSGAELSPITLAYETLGELNQEGDNAILVCHALTGDSHVAGKYNEDDLKPGWWDVMVGPGKPMDTDRYFIICSNVLGGCMGSTGPCSENPATGKPYGLEFPVVTIGDMVRAQKRLVEHLGVTKLLAAAGGSMGGMQVLEWTVRYPGMMHAALPLATTTRHSALNIAFHEIARQAIMADPHWNQGGYYDEPGPSLGLAVARMIGHVTYLSDDAMRLKFGRNLQDKDAFSFNLADELPDFQVESYLRYQGKKFVERFDANSFLYITKAADYFDLGLQHGNGSLVQAFSKAKARFLLVSFTSDWLYPTYQVREIVTALKKNGLDVSFCEIEAHCGHDAFLLRNDRLFDLVRHFLNTTHETVRRGGSHAL
ncbi:MAG: homoserine O-acetyltransferase [Desulfovibrio sp.]|nr:MAG: homoserine O-acetyltransferase [Desulfovibrio sp.]